jgi:hypothetical protein
MPNRVIQMPRRNREPTREEVLALKRLAVQIVAQLPQDQQEAIQVLDYAKELVVSFLNEARPA